MEHHLHSVPPTSTTKRRPDRALAGLTVCVALAGILLAVFAAGAVGSPTPATVVTPPASHTEDHRQSGFAQIVKTVRPAVVNITASHAMHAGSPESAPHGQPRWFYRDPNDSDLFGRPPFPDPRHEPRKGTGSGVIISPDGYVITNYHVIEGASSVTVTLLDQRTFAGTIVGSDPQTDLAVVHIQGRDLPFVAWGDSSTLEVGDYVLAIGSPFGLHSTVTQGIVSAKGRGGMGITQYEDFIQTDAAINPGNSGGALVNMRGELVGINTAILSRTGGYQGVGFAVPASIGQHISTSLVKTGTVSRGFLGVGVQVVTPELAQAFHLDHAEGAIVTDVREASPAAQAGMQRGDTIVRYHEQPVGTPQDLQRAVTTTPVGTEVTILVVRDQEEQTLHATIMEHPMSQRVAARHEADAAPRLAGLALEPLTPHLAQRLGVDDDMTGVVVTGIRAGSQAEEAGLVYGDIIREINHRPVESLNAFQQMVKSLQNDQPALLLIHRQGMSLFLTVKV